MRRLERLDSPPPLKESLLHYWGGRIALYFCLAAIINEIYLFFLDKISVTPFPICACAIYHFLTQLPNALAQCYLQRASAMLLTMYNALARCHFALARCYVTYNVQRASVLSLILYMALSGHHR